MYYSQWIVYGLEIIGTVALAFSGAMLGIRKKWIFLKEKYIRHYTNYMNIMDSIGLGAFTVIGINNAIQASYSNDIFLLLFVGVITGVGGGLFRDIMAGTLPYIFIRHIYACASLAGAVVCVFLMSFTGKETAMTTGEAVVVAVRFLAARFRWNLPKI
ncbi:TRIC cation channel family protein [Lachnospiraceae bacterium 54-53]